jgi:hypothetical protein
MSLQEWVQIMTRLGRWIDFEKDYKTMYPWFMESVWYVCCFICLFVSLFLCLFICFFLSFFLSLFRFISISLHACPVRLTAVQVGVWPAV